MTTNPQAPSEDEGAVIQEGSSTPEGEHWTRRPKTPDLSTYDSAQSVDVPRKIGKKILGSPAMDIQMVGGSPALPVEIKEGQIQISEEEVGKAEERIVRDFQQAVESGDSKKVRSFLWFVKDDERDSVQQFRDDVTQSLSGDEEARKRVLKEFTVVLPTRSMAERQVIKDFLRKEIEKLPVQFKTKDGAVLDTDEIEIVATVDGAKFKFHIASEQGIDQIFIPDSIGANQYIPDTNIERNIETGAIVIPLLSPPDGSPPMVSSVEVYRGQKINLNDMLINLEEENVEDNYSPPPPSVSPARKRATSPPTYVSVSSSH